MFNKPFSFNGRIGRTEYGVSVILYSFISWFLMFLKISKQVDETGIGLFMIVMLWLILAQGAKRCHDIDNNGLWQLIPFYVFVMIFKDGVAYSNEYGEDLKKGKRQNQIQINTNNIVNSSTADEIKKIKDLYDNQIINQEEFDKLKEKIINKV